jgi:2-dehydropantoate 2-reductase
VAEPILIWGAGAIGGTIGAYWRRAGVDVLLVDKVTEHVEACRTRGLAIEGPVESFTKIVPAATPQEVRGAYRRIVLAVKAQHTEEALEALAPHLAEDGYVLSAQNGLNEFAIARKVGPERTMGCFVNFGADWQGPGRILYGNRGAVVVGEIDGSIRERTREMYALLKLFEPDAVLTDDIGAISGASSPMARCSLRPPSRRTRWPTTSPIRPARLPGSRSGARWSRSLRRRA